MIKDEIRAVGPEQAAALLSIRKEYLRREVTIKELLQDLDDGDEDIDKLVTQVQKLKQENEQLTDTAIA